MGQQHQIEATEYKTRLIEFANQLALKRPDLNLLRDHPREEYPVLTESLEIPFEGEGRIAQTRTAQSGRLQQRCDRHLLRLFQRKLRKTT